MKKYLVIFSICTFILFAGESNSKRPVYKFAFIAQSTDTDTRDLTDYIKTQILSSNRGEAILQTQIPTGINLTSSINGDIDVSSLKDDPTFKSAEKIVLVQQKDSATQIQMVDMESGKLEYKNSLPTSISKTLLQDFFSFLDKKNIYLAITEKKSSPTSPLKFSQLKSKYTAGEAIRFELESNEDNYVYVMLIPGDKSDEPVLLFPSPTQTANYLKKGQKVTIPDGDKSLQAAPPYGRDKIKAFASKEEWTDFQFKNKKGDSFFKLLPPALTGSKSISLPDVMSKTILDTSAIEWEMEVLPN
ncbi:MAG: DUF4384 domain-containing protein [Leptospira sp.]|nr:DUF4384 domain-containing protein [Leptospira sp.]